MPGPDATPGQPAFRTWMFEEGHDPDDMITFYGVGTLAEAFQAGIAARQPQTAPGVALRERLALLDIIAAIGEHDEADVKYPVELLVSIERLAELALADGEPHVCEPLIVKPADDVKPAPELAAAIQDIIDRYPEREPAPELATLRALHRVVGHFAETWAELLTTLPDSYDCHMNCAEADAAADLYRALGLDLDAAAIIRAHGGHDDDEERATHDDPEGK